MRIGTAEGLRQAGAIGFLLTALFVGSGAAQDWPTPPCDARPHPPIAALDSPPNIEIWFGHERSDMWLPPACTGWLPRPFASLIAISGRFRMSGGAEALAARAGAVSAATNIRYWSVSRQRWRDLFDFSRALRTADPETTRADFSETELFRGAELHLIQDENNPVAPVVYRMTVRERTPDLLVLSIRNVSQARLFVVPLFEPGEQESITFVRRESSDVWRFYGLLRLGGEADPDAEDHAASLINRAVAVFRHIAGIPTDQEPPAVLKAYSR